MTTDTRQPWRRKRLSANERGYGNKWKRIRKIVLTRDKHLCRYCAEKPTPRITPAVQVDHIVPKARGGSDEMHNLISTCLECHTDKTAADNGQRVKLRFGTDGWPCD